MTSPSHGGDHAFESHRAHRFFFQSDAKIKAKVEDEDDEELHNYSGKLCNFQTEGYDESLGRIMTDRYIDDEGDEQIELLWEELIEEKGTDYDKNDPHLLKAQSRYRKAAELERKEEVIRDEEGGAELILRFTREELEGYTAQRQEKLAKKSRDWISQSSETLWDITKGEISYDTVNALRAYVLKRWESPDSHSKVLGFAVRFLKFLASTKRDPGYLSFELYLERPRMKKVKKAITERIVTRDDVITALQRINSVEAKGSIANSKARNFRAYVLLAAYTGLRQSTIKRLKVGQLRAAVNEEKPTLLVYAEQDKNRVEHYVPLHPLVVRAISEVLAYDFSEKNGDKPFFLFNSFEKWLERQKIPLPRVRDLRKAHLWLSDFRKFAEQFGDVIGWDSTNRKYVLAHGMTGVDWEHYKHPLPEDVYDIYLRSWGDIDLTR